MARKTESGVADGLDVLVGEARLNAAVPAHGLARLVEIMFAG
jgi:hypothetical protein